MKLLFDENLSPRLCRLLADIYPDSAHVRDIGLRGAEDEPVADSTMVNLVARGVERFFTGIVRTTEG